MFTRMLDNVVEVNGLPLEQQRDEIMRKRRHGMGFLGLGSTMTMLGMKYGSASLRANSPKHFPRHGAWPAGKSAWSSRPGEGPGPDHGRRVHRHRRDAAQAPGNGEGRLEGRPEDQRPRAARPLFSRYMQRVASVAPELVKEARRDDRRALHPPQLDRADRHHLAVAGQQRQQRHRAFVRPPLQPQRDPRRQEVEGKGRSVQLRAAGLPRAGQPQAPCRSAPTRPRSCRTTSSPPTTSRRRSTSTSRPPRRSGSIQLDLQDRERPDRLPVRRLQGHLPLRPPAGPEGLHHLPLQPGRLPGRAGEGNGPGEHHLPLRARRRQLRGRSQRATKRSNTTAKCTPPPTCSMR